MSEKIEKYEALPAQIITINSQKYGYEYKRLNFLQYGL